MNPPSVVFIHGVRASRAMWAKQLALLESRDIPARAIDLPGHGARRAEPFSIPGAMAAIDEAAAGMGGPVVVVGSSLGGYLALHWTARTARPVQAVLAAGATTSTTGVLGRTYELASHAIARLPGGGAWLSSAANRLTTPRHTPEVPPEEVPTIAEMAEVVRQMRHLDVEEDVAHIEVPIWFVNGRWDHFRWHERRWTAAAHRGRLTIVPKANHLVSLTNPPAFNAALTELLAHVSGAQPPGADAADDGDAVRDDDDVLTEPFS
ncbi:MAG TPA: alpha/beta hydrolase [Actinomycetaceae bacterium]|nr:alpha/beta hydrolase [Actinomycetaceae bacterium]